MGVERRAWVLEERAQQVPELVLALGGKALISWRVGQKPCEHRADVAKGHAALPASFQRGDGIGGLAGGQDVRAQGDDALPRNPLPLVRCLAQPAEQLVYVRSSDASRELVCRRGPAFGLLLNRSLKRVEYAFEHLVVDRSRSPSAREKPHCVWDRRLIEVRGRQWRFGPRPEPLRGPALRQLAELLGQLFIAFGPRLWQGVLDRTEPLQPLSVQPAGA